MKINLEKDQDNIIINSIPLTAYQLNNKYLFGEEGGEDLNYISNNVKLYNLAWNYILTQTKRPG